MFKQLKQHLPFFILAGLLFFGKVATAALGMDWWNI